MVFRGRGPNNTMPFCRSRFAQLRPQVVDLANVVLLHPCHFLLKQAILPLLHLDCAVKVLDLEKDRTKKCTVLDSVSHWFDLLEKTRVRCVLSPFWDELRSLSRAIVPLSGSVLFFSSQKSSLSSCDSSLLRCIQLCTFRSIESRS